MRFGIEIRKVILRWIIWSLTRKIQSLLHLNDAYSFDLGSMKTENGIRDTNNLVNETENVDKVPISADK